VDGVAARARRSRHRVPVRLVKGAYWDTEIKRAQERGLDAYPVFTRKAATDLSYMACAERLLALRPRLYPQFATHNALTVASILERAGGTEGYEFQRLHGMGDALYAALLREHPHAAVRTYAPVGGHADLLAYLVRRLLENGANSSFVSLAAGPAVPVERLLIRPAAALGGAEAAAHPRLPLPGAIYPDRRNSRGVEFGDRGALEARVAAIAAARGPARALPPVDGRALPGTARTAHSPVRAPAITRVLERLSAAYRAAHASPRAPPPPEGRSARTPASGPPLLTPVNSNLSPTPYSARASATFSRWKSASPHISSDRFWRRKKSWIL